MSLLSDSVVIDLSERRPIAQVLLDKFIRWYSAGWVPTTAELKSASDDELELLIKAKTHVDSRARIFAAHTNVDPVGASNIAERSMEAAAHVDGKSLIERATQRMRDMLAAKGVSHDAPTSQQIFSGNVGGEPISPGEKIVVMNPPPSHDPISGGDADSAQARVDVANAPA